MKLRLSKKDKQAKKETDAAKSIIVGDGKASKTKAKDNVPLNAEKPETKPKESAAPNTPRAVVADLTNGGGKTAVNHKQPSKKTFIMVFAAVGVLALVAGGSWYHLNNNGGLKEPTVAVVDLEIMSDDELNTFVNKEIDESSSEAILLKAEALALLGRNEEAIVIYDKSAASSSDSDVLMKLALTKLSAGDAQGSLDIMYKAREQVINSDENEDIKAAKLKHINNKITEIEMEMRVE